MARESRNHGTNECILLLKTIPVAQLQRMNVLIESRLAVEADGLIDVSEVRPTPDAVSEQEMRAVVERLSGAFSRETHVTYSGRIITLPQRDGAGPGTESP